VGYPEILTSLTCFLNLYCLWYVQEKLSESPDHVTMKVLQADGLVNTFRMLRAPIIIPGIQVWVYYLLSQSFSAFVFVYVFVSVCLSAPSLALSVLFLARTLTSLSTPFLPVPCSHPGRYRHVCLCVCMCASNADMLKRLPCHYITMHTAKSPATHPATHLATSTHTCTNLSFHAAAPN